MAGNGSTKVSVTSLDGKNGFAVTGQPSRWTDARPLAIGDVTGDGSADLLFTEIGGEGRYSENNLVGYIVPGARSGFAPVVDLLSLKQFRLEERDDPHSHFDYAAISAAGDLNGDGYGDFIVGTPRARNSNVSDDGSAYVVFGTAKGLPNTLLTDRLDGKDGFVIDDLLHDRRAQGLGSSVAAAGDVNGDGIDDVLVGAPWTFNNAGDPRSDGAAYLIYGRKTFDAKVEVPDLAAAEGVRIVGPDNANVGRIVAAVGDVNDDGIGDFSVSSRNSASLVYGRKGGFGTTLDLTKLDAGTGVTITASGRFERNVSATSAGDLNGDGIDDLFVRDWVDNLDSDAASVAVVFGKKGGFGKSLDLTTLKLNGVNGFRITPELGRFVDRSLENTVASGDATVGDFNGDGIDDLAFGQNTNVDALAFGKVASEHYISPGYVSSNVFVVYGRSGGGFSATLSTADLSGTAGFVVTGLYDTFSQSSTYRIGLTTAGDLNGDGADDLAIDTEYGFDGVVFGKPSEGVTRVGGSGDDTLTGTANGDVLKGLGGNDRLVGGAGDDRLDGGTGADRMEGGAGNDTFIVDQAGDVVIEAQAGDDRDTVITSVNYTLTAGQGIEVLRADPNSRANLTLTGNASINVIIGNAGNNLLHGGGGPFDRLFGGEGDDLYAVKQSDQVSEGEGQGNDTVVATTSYRLYFASEVETLQLATSTGAAKLDLTGNSYSQVIRGNSGRNILDGNGQYYEGDSHGADSLYGKRGDDIYVIHRSDDKAYELAGEGKDAVVSHVSYTLMAGQEIESLQLHSRARDKDFDLTGNEFANTIVGFHGKNVLDGGLGADVLKGYKGVDTFSFSTKLGDGNIDRIIDFESGETIRLEDSIFTALAPGQLKSSEFKNISTGKADADDHILYKQETGQLFYDADGGGKGAALWFATLDNKAALTAADILVV